MRVLVIDNYDSFTYNLAQVLDEVVGEGVVVVDDEDPRRAHGHASCRVASSIARATARALLRDSSYS